MELSRDMQIVADIVGETATKRLMIEVGGMYLYIPKPDKTAVLECLKANGYDSKIVAKELKVSLSKVYKVLQAYRKEQKNATKSTQN